MKAFDTLTQQIQDFQVFRVGDDVLSYVGIVVNHEIRTPSLNNQYFMVQVSGGFF